MTNLTFSSLPAPFGDCAAHITQVPGPTDIGLKDLVRDPTIIERGIHAIIAKWGPGDPIAASSLWSYGYFLRFLRPILAYGVLSDVWLDVTCESLNVVVSDNHTVGKFVTARQLPQETTLQALVANIALIIDYCCGSTGTKERLHRSNAEFLIFKSLGHLDNMGLSTEQLVRVSSTRAILQDFSTGQFGRTVNTHQCPPTRRVCCLRDRLAGLSRCAVACPLSL